ncbi:MAG: glycosyltransferase [bacterium]
MKIVFFDLNRLDFEGGCEKQIAAMANALAENWHEVSIICNSFLYVRVRPRFENILYAVLGLKNRHETKNMLKLERNCGKARINNLSLKFHIPCSDYRKQIIRKLIEAEIIYCKNEFMDLLYLYILIGRENFRKVVIGVHTAIFLQKADSIHSRIHNMLYFSRIYKKLLQLSGAIHVPNSSYVDSISVKYKVGKSKVHYIPYIVSGNEFKIPAKRSSDRFQILFAGRLTEQKGVDYLRDLIKSLAKNTEFENTEFIIAGNGDMDAIPEKLSQEYSNIKFMGFVDNTNELYKDIDLAIILSRWETVSYIALESHSRGIPVVSFDIPGPSDIIENGITGKLVALGDIQAFKDSVLEFFYMWKNDQESFLKMRGNAYKRIKENFSVEQIVPQMGKMFKKITSLCKR